MGEDPLNCPCSEGLGGATPSRDLLTALQVQMCSTKDYQSTRFTKIKQTTQIRVEL